MSGRMAATVCVLALGFLGLASADTFTHKKTGDAVKGGFLGTAFVSGEEQYLVRTEGGSHRKLPVAEWDRTPEPGAAEPPKPAAGADEKQYHYLGRPVSRDWFEGAFRRFSDKIALVNGEYVDLQEEHPPGQKAPPASRVVRIGTGRAAHSGTVSRVLGDEAVIASIRHNTTQRGETIHVKGLDAKVLGEGTALPEMDLLCVGNHGFKPRPRARRRRIRSFTVCLPLTREQFADALEKGFQLALVKPVYRDCARCKGTGQIHTRKRRLVAGSERLGHWEEYTVTSTCPECKGQKKFLVGTTRVEVPAR